MEWAVSFSPSAAIIAFATSAGIGVVFGYFPARRAAHYPSSTIATKCTMTER